MFKPLLRTIPVLSGNVKLACHLLDYKEQDGEFISEVRYAKLLPISSSLYQRKVEAKLLGSSWEYDLKNFYSIYNDVFYNSCFNYDKTEMDMLDKHNTQYFRNTDFEFGVKRISYSKNGFQFAFFAPFYIDSPDDLPLAFVIDANIHTSVNSLKKTIRVSLAETPKSRYNYLLYYLKKYVKNLNSDVCFLLHDSNQATYYGIDVKNGGFVKYVDNNVKALFHNQTTINNVDATICQGFRRGHLAMKQIMPLSFYFNIDDILTPSEKKKFKNAEIEFSGYYIDKTGTKRELNDFSIDYDYHAEHILRMNNQTGLMNWIAGDSANIMDESFPSLNEKRYVGYQHSSKLTPIYCRWKLKYSDDEHPYITNFSWAFSHNQGSNYKYGQFPVSFAPMYGLASELEADNKFFYNLIFPLSSNTATYNIYNPQATQKYANIFNNYCLSWFNTISNDLKTPIGYSDEFWKTSMFWKQLQDDCVYYNGILYDLTNIYSQMSEYEKVDKFGVFVNLETNFMSPSDIDKLKFADKTIRRQITASASTNVDINDQLVKWAVSDTTDKYKNFLYVNEDDIFTGKQRQDVIESNNIFTYSEDNTGNFIDLSDYGVDFYELNKYYDMLNVAQSLDDGLWRVYEEDRVLSTLYSTYMSTYMSEDTFRKITNEALNIVPLYSDISYVSNKIADISGSAYYGVQRYESEFGIDSYCMLPIYKSSSIAYAEPTLSYMLDLNWSSYNEETGQYTDYTIDEPLLTYTKEYLKNNLHYSTYDSPNIKHPDYESYNGMSYFSSGKIKYLNKIYGNNFYTQRTFVKASDINTLVYDEYPVAYLGDIELKYPQIKRSDANIETSVTYAFRKSIDYLYNTIGSYMTECLEKFAPIYEYNPITEYMGQIVASGTFSKRSETMGKMYGREIPYDKVPYDKNVLWIDRYNMDAVIAKYSYMATGTQSYQLPEANDHNSAYFYVKMLNKLHLFYYYSELVKDEKLQFPNSPKYWAENWSKHVYIKVRSLVEHWNYTQDMVKVPELDVMDEYIPIHDAKFMFKNVPEDVFSSFRKFYANLLEKEAGMFFLPGEDDKVFELAYYDLMYRVDETIWKIIGCEEPHYNDIYIYRPYRSTELSEKNTVNTRLRFVPINESRKYDFSEQPRYVDIDGCLCPLFKDVFEQKEIDEKVYADYSLHNITECHFETPDGDIVKNYRYDCSDVKLMVQITDEERELYNITKTYNEYKYCSAGFDIKYNDLGYDENLHMNTYVNPETGEKYGFYLINIKLDNTSNSFKLVGMNDMSTDKYTAYEYLFNLKQLYYMNGVNISKNPDYVNQILKNVLPFTNINTLAVMQELTTIIKPSMFNLDMMYSKQLIDNTNGSDEINIYKSDNSKSSNIDKYKRISVYRYGNAIVPYIVPRKTLSNTYALKVKNIKKTLVDTAKFNSIGDSVLYKRTEFIDTFLPFNVYTLSPDEKKIPSYNYVDYKYTPLEYKHFQASHMLNLPSQFDVTTDGKYLYDELLALQTEERSIEIFAGYMNSGRVTKFTDDEILFLYNKYEVNYDSYSVGLNFNKTDKVYRLTYKFSLL